MNITHFPIALFVPYTVLTLVNALFRKLGAVWAFTSAELLTMLAMGLVGAAEYFTSAWLHKTPLPGGHSMLKNSV